MSDFVMEAPDPIKLFREYFQKRGISSEIIDRNGIALQTFEQLGSITPSLPHVRGRNGFAALIPYHDRDGNPVNYHTARVLQLTERTTFRQSLGLEQAKLICPTGAARAYFPVHNPPITKDTRCVVTESAVKALVAANCGFFAIGLNGCWGFRSKHTTDKLLPDLARIPWKKFKDIVFVPDSNVETNDDVTAAAARFCSDLAMLHRVEPTLLILPPAPDGEDWGLDDYYASNGLQSTQSFLNGEGTAPPLDEYLEAMHDLNREVVYVREANVYAVEAQNLLAKEDHFHNLFATVTYTNDDGARKSASRAWKTWDGRREAFRVISRPGKPTEYSGDYNLWRPSDVEPFKGDVSTHLDFLRRAVPDQTEREWLQQWIASIVQRPDDKQATALVFYSSEQGTGKSMLADAIGRMLGRHNVAHPSMDAVASSFNASYAGKQLIVVNETNGDVRSGRALMDKLKVIITEPEIHYIAKGRDGLMLDNYSNLILTTNHVDSLSIEPTDRRFAVFEFCSQFRFSSEAEEWGAECYEWHMNHTEELLYYYENLPIDGFSSKAPAPMTQAKEDMSEAAGTEYDHIARDIVRENTRVDSLVSLGIEGGVRYLELKRVIHAAFPGITNERSATTRLGAALKRLGIEKRTFKIQTPQGAKVVRMYDLDGGPADSAKATQDFLGGTTTKH